jgi:4-hydroxymandelate oxidase
MDEPVNVHELERLAQARLPESAYDYVAGGAGDEHTLRWNVERWSSVRLAPRALVDVGRLDTTLELLGTSLPHPLLLAPVAAHALYAADAELATLRGAASAGALYVQSTLGSTDLAEVGAAAAGAGQPWWFQLYVQRDRGFTRDLVAAAEAAGAGALVLTVDTPALGARDRDRRAGPPRTAYPNLAGLLDLVDPTPLHQRLYLPVLDPTVSWTVLADLLSWTRLPVVVKGVLRPDDAVRALDAGVAAVIVSNHGARNLDTVPATVDALPGVVRALGGALPVLVDGGIRRGTDVAKALALGARAVLLGRPYVWGLSAYGAQGVTLAVEMLVTELRQAMALLGTPSLADLTPDVLWPPAPRPDVGMDRSTPS